MTVRPKDLKVGDYLVFLEHSYAFDKKISVGKITKVSKPSSRLVPWIFKVDCIVDNGEIVEKATEKTVANRQVLYKIKNEKDMEELWKTVGSFYETK